MSVERYLVEQSDEALCELAASNNRLAEEELVRRYSRLVRICARPYFLAGGDSEDLIQEGMLGLLKAIREFDRNRDASFRTFAQLCVHRSILSAVASASRNKHAPLNESIPFETPSFDSISSFAESNPFRDNPEDLFIGQEEHRERLQLLKKCLSGFEIDILDSYLQGLSYQEIARRVGRPAKSVDNAVQRIRRKVAQYFSTGVYSES